MTYILILLLFIVILSILYNKETFSNYSNAIYAIRPPYAMAKEFNPDHLNPYKILKYNFLPYPMEGYKNKTETFENPLNYLFKKSDQSMETGMSKMGGHATDTKTPLTMDNQFNNMKDVEYSSMTEDEKYTRKIVDSLGKKEMPFVNMRIQSTSSINPEKTVYEVKSKNYKFFRTKDCGDDYRFTGAYFTNPSGISCNGEEINFKKAKVVARINDGRIEGIEVIDGGSGHINPQIEILSNDRTGVGARVKITAIGDGGSIEYMEVLDGGRGYKEIPTIVIRNSVENNSCYLCEK